MDGVDVSKHFSYFAVDGGSGETRWTHEASESNAHCKLCVRNEQSEADLG